MPLKSVNHELTTREREVLTLYDKLFERNGAPPSLKAIGTIMGVYPNTVRHAFLKLEEKGFLKRVKKVVTRTHLAVSPKGKAALL
jgi:DNA-binding transcriptional regulator YhcF (GntR family)